MEENEIGPPCLTPYRKISSRWIKDLNVKGKSTKPSEEKIARYLYALMVGKWKTYKEEDYIKIHFLKNNSVPKIP